MTLPCIPQVEIRLGTGVSFGDGFVLGSDIQGVLGTNELASSLIETIEITNQVQRISISHGRDRQFEEYLPGQAVIEFLDFTGDWNPANINGPYYQKIRPMRQLQVATRYNGTTFALFSGFITSWDWQWADQSVEYAVVTVQAVDAFRILALANIETVPGAANKDLPGERINQILDAVDWPPSARMIDIGDTELENDPGGIRSALSAIQTIENSDLGAFFIDHLGRAVYYDRNHLSQKAAGTAFEFDDDGTHIQYQNVDISLDDTELVNEVTLTRVSGQPQTVSDQNSIDEYFIRSYARSDLMMETNDLALARATQILNYRKQVRIRVDSLTLDMSSESNRVLPGLSLEIGDPIIVTRQISGGTDLTLRVIVQGHTSDITPDRWITTFTTSYPLTTAFILGSTEFGILGTNNL